MKAALEHHARYVAALEEVVYAAKVDHDCGETTRELSAALAAFAAAHGAPACPRCRAEQDAPPPHTRASCEDHADGPDAEIGWRVA